MRRAAVLLLTLIALVAVVPAAQAGTAIKTLTACPNSYLFYTGPSVSQPKYRAALLCLINAARKAERLPALTRSAPLEKVGQAQSDRFAKTGSASHGKSITDITKRFAAQGYRAAAYNEGFSVLNPGATPYAFAVAVLAHAGVPCTEVLDPRFRDIGIGVSLASQQGQPVATTLALEFGLRAGQRQPSTNTSPASHCGHKLPAPLVTAVVVQPRGAPVISTSTIAVTLQCTAKVACTLTATISLPDAHATASPGPVTIGAGKSQAVTFTFDPAALHAESIAQTPSLKLSLTVTAPAQYTDAFTSPL